MGCATRETETRGDRRHTHGSTALAAVRGPFWVSCRVRCSPRPQRRRPGRLRKNHQGRSDPGFPAFLGPGRRQPRLHGGRNEMVAAQFMLTRRRRRRGEGQCRDRRPEGTGDSFPPNPTSNCPWNSTSSWRMAAGAGGRRAKCFPASSGIPKCWLPSRIPIRPGISRWARPSTSRPSMARTRASGSTSISQKPRNRAVIRRPFASPWPRRASLQARWN